jgi:hypothetical protein
LDEASNYKRDRATAVVAKLGKMGLAERLPVLRHCDICDIAPKS